jgi:hypothetical protein
MDTKPQQRIFYEAPLAFLYDPLALRQFFLHPGMGVEEMLNALLRLALYFALAVCIVRRSLTSVLLVPLVVAAAALAIHKAVTHQRNTRSKLLESMNANTELLSGAPGVCRRPSPNNPFMNVLVSDIAADPGRPKACDLSDPRVRRRADHFHSSGQPRNPDDIYNRTTSRRQFYAMPNTEIPNDQTSFAQWLYACSGPSGKERHAPWAQRTPVCGSV